MLEEQSFRRLKNILTTVPKLPAWSEVLDNADEDEIEQIKVSQPTVEWWIVFRTVVPLLGDDQHLPQLHIRGRDWQTVGELSQ